MNEVEKIISSARDKYTVHECKECTYRKCCELVFGSADCMSRRVSISLMLGIEDSFFSKLLDDIDAAHKRELAEWEAAACACVSDAVMPGKVAVEHVPVGNAAALRQAVIKALTLLQVCTWPSWVSLDGVAEVVHEIDAALDKTPRNCDVGTPDEQGVRCLATMRHWRKAYQGDALITAIMKWAQDPYKDEGGAE